MQSLHVSTQTVESHKRNIKEVDFSDKSEPPMLCSDHQKKRKHDSIFVVVVLCHSS